jgi:hypothetical protein
MQRQDLTGIKGKGNETDESDVEIPGFKSCNAELRRGGPLVGRTSRRVSLLCFATNPTLIQVLTAAICDNAWKAAFLRPSALKL